MFSIFNKSYPPSEPGLRSIYLSLGVGIFVAGFLSIFQPFGIFELDFDYKILKILGFGVITFLVMFCFYHLLPLYATKVMSDKNWTVIKEIIHFISMVIVLAVLNNLYSLFLRGASFTWSNLFEMMVSTSLVAIVPGFFMVLLDYNHKLKKYVKEVESFNFDSNQKVTHASQTKIELNNDNSNDVFIINPSTFLYAEADGNYVSIVQLTKGVIEKKLLRSTLKKVEEKISDPNVIKCHRSFIINLQNVEDANGNAQGYKLKMKTVNEIVPVSRKYVPQVKAYFAK